MNGSKLTMDKLLAVMKTIPQPIGYALLVPSSTSLLKTHDAYKLSRSEFMPGDALYWFVVPRSMLRTAIESLNAYPSDDIPGEAYRFNVFKDDSL